MIHRFVLLNGIYDIICAASIGLHPYSLQNPFETLHTDMFIGNVSSREKRFLAYWIFTYGCVRCYSGFIKNTFLDRLAALTYFIEAGCLLHESCYIENMVDKKAIFVILSSVCIGVSFAQLDNTPSTACLSIR